MSNHAFDEMFKLYQEGSLSLSDVFDCLDLARAFRGGHPEYDNCKDTPELLGGPYSDVPVDIDDDES